MKWEPAAHAGDVLEAAVALATFAAASPALNARPAVRREVLRMYVLSLVTQGTLPGKGRTRYISDGAAAAAPADRLEHEHVYTRSHLADLILENPREDAVRWILSNLAVAATVTSTEHARLTRVPKSVQGWDRYTAADVAVTDLVTGRPVLENPQIPSWIRPPGTSDATDRVALPTNAVEKLLATEELRALLDPEVTDLRGMGDWPTRRAEAFQCIGIVSRAAGQPFDSLPVAKEQLFAYAAGGGFGIREWLQDAVLGLFEPGPDNLLRQGSTQPNPSA